MRLSATIRQFGHEKLPGPLKGGASCVGSPLWASPRHVPLTCPMTQAVVDLAESSVTQSAVGGDLHRPCPMGGREGAAACSGRPNRALCSEHSRGLCPNSWMRTRVQPRLDRVRHIWVGFASATQGFTKPRVRGLNPTQPQLQTCRTLWLPICLVLLRIQCC